MRSVHSLLGLFFRLRPTRHQPSGFFGWPLGVALLLTFSATWSCDPSVGPDGLLHVLDGATESSKESTSSDAAPLDFSEPTPNTEPTSEFSPPEEAAQSEPSPDPAPTEPNAEPPTESSETTVEMAPEPRPENTTETIIPENTTETIIPEETAPTERTTEPRPESPPPDPVGGNCQVQGVQGTCLRISDCASPNKPIAGYCPGPSDIQCCVPPSTNPVCDPNAQPQPNIGITEPAGIGGCPAGMTPVSTFCIDRWEAFVVEVLTNGQTQPWSPYFNPGTRKIRALSAPNAVPQGYINGDQAKRACQEAGKRLCTDQEWLRACQGPNAWTYPYGNTRQAGVCNDARSVHPAVEYFQSSDPSVFSKIQHQCLNQLPQSLAKTGAKVGCITAEGVFDMMGNLHEWTADPAGTFRGGFYVDTYRNGNGCLYRTTAHTTPHWDYSTGFRCCANIP